MLELAFIMPTAYLSEFDYYSDYSFVEAEIYRKDKKYQKYFKKMKKKGRFTLLDNSVYLRKGTPIETDVLVDIAKDLQPDEIVAPDVYYDWEKTLENIKKFSPMIKKELKGIRVMGVPQGSTFAEWLMCYHFMLEEKIVDTIGIPMRLAFGKQIDNHRARLKGRRGVIEFLEWDNRLEKKISYHTLGLANPIELELFSKKPWIRSNDSSMAVKYGLKGEKFTDKGLRQKKEIILDFTENKKLTNNQKAIINYNIHKSKSFSKGENHER